MKKIVTSMFSLAGVVVISAAAISMGTNSLFFFNQPKVPKVLMKKQ